MPNSNNKKVIVGLSGGVDSSVAAYLLKQQGYEVTGLFMQNWNADKNDPNCTAEQDLTDARSVAEKLGIEFITKSFAKEYWDRVFEHCLQQFQLGNTPNPDILCNREIKFKAFLDEAIDMGADYIATGHYVRNRLANNKFTLLRGLDNNKDQSYFLYAITQYAVSKSLFPIGELQKPEVRKIAEAQGFITHDKKDSTGICFIGERKFKTFLQEYLLNQPGKTETEDGTIIGKHDGLMFYTIGQRRGLNLGGQADFEEAAWYVIGKDLKRNVLVVGQNHDHPALMRHNLICDELTWISGDAPEFPLKCSAKTRYRQRDSACAVNQLDDGKLSVEFDEAQWAITPGQSVVFYLNEACLGGGIILNSP